MTLLAPAITIFAETVSSKLHLESCFISLARAKNTSNTQHDPMQIGQFLCHLGMWLIKLFAIWEHFPQMASCRHLCKSAQSESLHYTEFAACLSAWAVSDRSDKTLLAQGHRPALVSVFGGSDSVEKRLSGKAQH